MTMLAKDMPAIGEMPKIVNADLWAMFLNENKDASAFVAVQLCELFERMQKAESEIEKAAFERGYTGGLQFGLAVCDERDATIAHVRGRIDANLKSRPVGENARPEETK